MNYNLPSVLFWILSILMAITLQDIFYCLTGKFIVQNHILNYDEYKFMVFVIFVTIFIFLASHFEYHIVYWQTTFVGAYSFIRV